MQKLRRYLIISAGVLAGLFLIAGGAGLYKAGRISGSVYGCLKMAELVMPPAMQPECGFVEDDLALSFINPFTRSRATVNLETQTEILPE
jgi:hypothetical protein